MTTRFTSLENRVANLNNRSTTSDSSQPTKLFQSVPHPNPHRPTDKYDYNPNIQRKADSGAPPKLNNWNFPTGSSESYRAAATNRDENLSQYSNRSQDNGQPGKDGLRRSSTVDILTNRIGRRNSDNQARLEIALYKHKQFCAEQAQYRDDLKEQMQQKQRNLHNEKINDMKANNSGLVIGEVHEGLDVDRFAKNMRIRQNNKMIKKILDRSFTNLERSVSSQSLRDFSNRHSYSSVCNSALPKPQGLNKSLIEERDDEDYESCEKYSPEFHQRRVTRDKIQEITGNDYPSYSEVPTDSRHQLKKVHHQKLKESIQNQIKKHEDYTTKLSKDQMKRKQDFSQALELQVANNQFKKKAAEHKERSHEKHNSISHPVDRAWESKSALLAEIEKKYKVKLGGQEKSEDGTKHIGQDGRYKRIIDDTVKRMLTRQSKSQTICQPQEKVPDQKQQVEGKAE